MVSPTMYSLCRTHRNGIDLPDCPSLQAFPPNRTSNYVSVLRVGERASKVQRCVVSWCPVSLVRGPIVFIGNVVVSWVCGRVGCSDPRNSRRCYYNSQSNSYRCWKISVGVDLVVRIDLRRWTKVQSRAVPSELRYGDFLSSAYRLLVHLY